MDPTVTAKVGLIEARVAVRYLERMAQRLDQSAREHAKSGREHASSEAAATMVDARYLWATALALKEGAQRTEKRQRRAR